MPPIAVLLPAAGQSTRFGGGDKLLAPLNGRAVIAHTVEAFLAREDVAAIVVATGDAEAIVRGLRRSAVGADARVKFVAGGASRAHSVRNALAAVEEWIEWVAVHDAARPLVSQGLIDRTLEAACRHGAAAPALAVHLTIKEAGASLPAPVRRTVPRRGLYAMQTPQIMRRTALAEAMAACPVPLEEITDDAQLLELAGHGVWLVAGEERNLKITTSLDLRVAELVLRADGDSAAAGDIQP